MKRAGNEAGFTLVEMMVALLIFGMIAVAGVTVMRSTVYSQQIVRARVDRVGEFQRLRAVIKADLGQAAVRRTRTADGGFLPTAFTGGEGQGGTPLLALVRRGWENPDGASRASLQYVEYRRDGRKLERFVRPALDGAIVGDPQILSEGVEDLHIAFFYRGEWTTSWNGGPELLPEAVRLDLQIEGVGPVTQLFLTPGRGLG
jgi:general secretion pathway protein J